MKGSNVQHSEDDRVMRSKTRGHWMNIAMSYPSTGGDHSDVADESMSGGAGQRVGIEDGRLL